MSLYVDPEEVLCRLKLLGYENISEKQLQDFIRDLKKLIKYDLKKRYAKEKELVAHDASYYDSSYSRSSTEISCIRTKSGDFSGRDSRLNSSGETGSSSDTSSSFRSDSINLPRYEKTRQKVILKPRNERLPNSRLSEEKKPKSFIRSWKLNQPPGVIKSDPVSLYHWYQQCWNKQKVPGEEPYKQLRWSVREKMLGDDPNPRPMSQASGYSSRNFRK